MKKTLSLAIALILALTLAACGGGSAPAAPAAPAAPSAAAPAADGSAAAEAPKQEIDWPSKAVQVIVPFNPGGDTDFNARAYTEELGKILGKPVVITNVNGNGGAVGATEARNSAADGSTALFFHTAMFVNKAVEASDFGLDGFEIVCVAGQNAGNVVCVNSKSKYQTLKDLIDDSKANPGKVTFSANAGATTYVMGVLLNMAGAELNLVDLGGASERVAALLGGHVDVIPNPLGTAVPYIESGDFRALALLEDERNSVFADVPTAVEQGYDVSLPIYYFMAFPKGTPQEIVDKMADACRQVSEMEGYQQSILETYQQTPFFLAGKEANDLLSAQEAEIMAMAEALK